LYFGQPLTQTSASQKHQKDHDGPDGDTSTLLHALHQCALAAALRDLDLVAQDVQHLAA
jgi:hypothetical protein